ncbi:hypothetical protein ABW19_dt0203269 [Dactylella cylindrospora]|nr:hypothetical protein ABW19_dt0203269 [Dactylella cylindrospora]
MLDKEYVGLRTPDNDDNSYIFGQIGRYKIVLACLPKGIPGTTSAANVAKDISRSFPSLKYSFMVGIGGGVPSDEIDIRLGDVVVSVPSGRYGGIVQYDFGKTIKEGKFCPIGTLNKPPSILLNAVQQLQSTHDLHGNKIISQYISKAAKKYPHKARDFSPPFEALDQLFYTEYEHQALGQTCAQCSCDPDKVKRRMARDHIGPRVFYGNIASGNQVMKHGITRDRVAKDRNILCFEMEAAGLMDTFPCIVIRGISDYADPHKNDNWQSYAAIVAAAYAKELLSTIKPQEARETNQQSLSRLSRLRTWPTYIFDVTATSCLLNSLQFTTMDDRYAGITKAHVSLSSKHTSTFDWIFTKPGLGFVDWLKSDGGIYWFNGKAGSGKSTLMKFIMENSALQQNLLANDKDRTWIIAGFFFWSGGSKDQRSLIGLLRTILYQVLKAANNLTSIAFPDEFERVRSTLRQAMTEDVRNAGDKWTPSWSFLKRNISTLEFNWNAPLLLRGLRNVLSQKDCSINFLLLIDGLDEYEATQEELENLVEILKSYNSPNVKLCLSSRPWTVFERNFGGGNYPSLLLQNLTREDIKLYVPDSINQSKMIQTLQKANPMKMVDLYSSIVRKSEGVFLWVRLVVKAVVQGFQNGDRISDIQVLVDELPSDLEKLYRLMLSRIPEKHRKWSAQMFAIMDAAADPPTALTLWNLGEEMDPMEKLSNDTKQARCYQLQLRLMNHCAGLLEVRVHQRHQQYDSNPDLLLSEDSWSFSSKQRYTLHPRVHHIHRTAYDFLQTNEAKEVF